jgi:hypothetical protein
MNRRQALKTLALAPLAPSILTASPTPEKSKGVWGFLNIICNGQPQINRVTQQESLNSFARKAFELCPSLSTCKYGCIDLYLDSEEKCKKGLTKGLDFTAYFRQTATFFQWAKLIGKYSDIQTDRHGWTFFGTGEPATFFKDSH